MFMDSCWPQYEWLEIYKNKYEYEDDSEVTKSILLEEFYYPKDYKLLSRDQYIGIGSNGRYMINDDRLGYEDRMKYLRNMIGVKSVELIPRDLDFTIEDENFVDRMSNQQRLDRVDRFMLSLWLYRKQRPTKESRFKDRNQIHISF